MELNPLGNSPTGDGRPLISVVVPAYNEEECIEELARRLQATFESEMAYRWEAIIIENGSADRTWELLLGIQAADERFKLIQLARNFRMDGGLTAGLDFATGDACVLMTADLQDPPELIPEFLRHWEEGYENVYGVVTARHGTSRLRTFNSRAFYWLAGKLTDGAIPRNASDFRLLDRKVYEAVRQMRERNRFVRGLVAWTGFRSMGIPMERPPRFAGESKAHSLKVLELAVKGIFAYSYVPLRLITVIGLITSTLAVIGLFLGLSIWIVRGVPFAGYGSLVSLVLLLFGVLGFMLGILSEYVALIYDEVKLRPNYVVSRQLGLQPTAIWCETETPRSATQAARCRCCANAQVTHTQD